MVIPVRDGEDALPALLGSLERQTLPRDRFEVIVVDNASRDATAAIARAAGAVVASEPVPNRSRARNRGIAAARAARIAFTDADCVASPGWLEALLGCAGRAPLLAGPVVTTTSASPNPIERLEREWRFAQEQWVEQGWAATANLCAERAALDAIGAFDPAYRGIGEDADLCIRAGRAGYELGWCAGAEVSHRAESTLMPMLKRAFRHGYGANQALHRVGTGHSAWRDPLPLVRGDGALERLGLDPSRLPPADRRALRRLARAAYAARVGGSVWAELRRAR